jgi:glycosyltransferase involved in cell wall biosynthesis
VRAAIVSTYPPRVCGIGTFAADLRSTLLEEPGVERVDVVAVVSEPSSPQRRDLTWMIAQDVRGDYVRAARTLGRLDVDVVLLQHEYGIFGGPDGEYVLSFAEELVQPLVATLHTVLSHPTHHQLGVLTSLCAQSELVIVMTETAQRLLLECGACPVDKVRVVPHGAPTRLITRAGESSASSDSPESAASSGRYRRIERRFLLSTFGLISAGKGLETVIDALPSMIERHPEIVYVIAGRTHPDIAHREGEQYRLMLERKVLELDLAEHVEFDDRFLSIDEISDLLAATDVFVTPYRNKEQIASGALTFAVAAGCCVVSTPYWYARRVAAHESAYRPPAHVDRRCRDRSARRRRDPES